MLKGKITMNFVVKRLFGVICLMAIVYVGAILVAGYAGAQETGTAAVTALTPEKATVMKWGFLAAALAVGLGSVGAGVAVGYVGAAAVGLIGERPEMAARALIFVGLAEGIAIYGVILALMILGKI